MVEELDIHRGWLEQTGGLPPICLRTGLQTGGRVRKRKVVTAPAWVAIFILFGALPYALLRMAIGEQMTFLIPESPDLRKKRWSTAAAATLLATFGFFVLIVGVANQHAAYGLLGFAMVIGSIALAIWNGRAHSVAVRVKHKDPTVRLKRVDANTAAEIRRHMMPRPPGAALPPPTGGIFGVVVL